jgi:phosphate transport system substrate-binding protein
MWPVAVIERANVRLAAILTLALILSGCGRQAATDQQLTVTGSTSVTPFAEQLAEVYEEEHPGVKINIQGLGSSAGIQAAANGTVEIGMSSRHLEADEAEQLEASEIARDALAVIVHPTNPIETLSSEQVRRIFSGEIENWRDVGGPDATIVVVTREAGSGTYGAFEELVMHEELPVARALRQGSNGAVRQIVAGTPRAVGYISLGIVDDTVKPIAIDAIEASAENVLSDQYHLVRPFLFVYRTREALSPLAGDFLSFVLSAEGQAELVQAGLIQGADAR